ncbi:electrogenic sodium bicarbonate cotransporter 4 isoform X5 [Bos mutus]|uniref:electrogenic sodium bicarbonate cotransporter 4 isoform X5 n=1 Tax=Bos mutus TaxID=72004 RepID=UPI0038B4FCD3
MKVEEEEAGVGKLDYRRRCQDQEDCRSIHIGLSVPSYPHRKRDQKGQLPGLQKAHWGLRPDKPQQGLASACGSVDRVSKTRSPAAEQLQDILGEEDEAPNPTLFTEMDTLQHDGDQMEWKESARWIKFEEKVEEGGERWSKPHVSTLSLHSLFELRTCLQTGTVLLDLDGGSLPQIIDDVIEKQIEDGLLRPELRERVSYVLLRKHRHQTTKPIHRSLADIGKAVSSTSSRSPARSPKAGPSLHHSTEDLRVRQSANYGRLCHAQSRSMNDISLTPNTDQRKNKFMKKIPKDSEASNVLVGEVDFLDQPFIAFVRLIQSAMLGGVTEVPVPTRFLFILLGPSGRAKSYNEIGRAIATLMVDDLFSDVAYKARNREDLIAGIDEFLDEVIVLPPGEWDPNIRIEPPKKVPSADKRKSVFSLTELGQMNGSVAGGGGGAAGGGAAGGGGGGGAGGGSGAADGEMPTAHEIGEELIWTGRFFGGLCLDVKRKLPWFPSDFYDGFHIQSISAILFIYLGCITNAITFGGLLGDATDNYQGVMESFLGTAMAGSLFCLFSGQPLIILSSTGPILIFEKLLFDFSKGNGLDYMEFRLWIGLHSAVQCLILVATDASFVIKYITRFTEEGFSTLISFIFIYDAIKKMIGTFKYYPINMNFKPDSITTYKCECVAPDTANTTLFNASATLPPNTNTSLYNPLNLTALDWSLLSKKECLNYGGRLLGDSCQFIPDLALMSFILFFGTYSMTLTLKKFKFSRYFPTKVRALIADFSIIFSILLFCGIDACFGLATPKLLVPSEIKPTRPDRGWFVAPFGKNPWWVYLASILPALLVTILIFMDQQITAVIVNRKENKLRGTESDWHHRLHPDRDLCLPGSYPAVHPFASAVWSLPLHGCGLPEWHPVLGSLQTLPDARQAPARPCLPAARAAAPDPPLHPGADTLLGCALDPQVHNGRHHLPSHDPGSHHCSKASGPHLFPA